MLYQRETQPLSYIAQYKYSLNFLLDKAISSEPASPISQPFIQKLG